MNRWRLSGLGWVRSTVSQLKRNTAFKGEREWKKSSHFNESSGKPQIKMISDTCCLSSGILIPQPASDHLAPSLKASDATRYLASVYTSGSRLGLRHEAHVEVLNIGVATLSDDKPTQTSSTHSRHEKSNGCLCFELGCFSCYIRAEPQPLSHACLHNLCRSPPSQTVALIRMQ